ncbi:tripartite tricarboxylate transporter TctB family protein [Escherichia fergusonii]|uniref:tripartite tricarboxylate transporter TctB family protein n=1 Tax=Escherichia fergusonii TaxID=564 RepID=UPI0006144A4A|nr:tripartite tricarboxylate transporter TctB family protein [Escherichia fergusonii]EHG6159011.1 tripartite tricarboxylate transporter TctB family protein [Escherichia fergusonii]EHK3067081.1 tripartite tricarboxylate transporter TctB family protein [Escherichia fergusonii]EHK3071898.1 tripartite tricarboxylate transporter TctB family protein [Escherichia fergusonii]EIQ6796794.1 tripartite tricarboxylate transporter TctB family protein [Escherichia fergusonii]EJB0946737.1 tripartite tricarbox
MGNNKRSEFILGISMLIFGLIYGVYALQIPGSEGIDSQTFPVSIAVIIILLSVIQTIKGYRLHQQNKVTQEESSKVSYQRLLLTAALIFCCIFFLESLGFVISCAIYIFLQTLVLLPRKKKRNYPLFAVVAFVVSSSIFFLFRFGFDILLPAGVMGALL